MLLPRADCIGIIREAPLPPLLKPVITFLLRNTKNPIFLQKTYSPNPSHKGAKETVNMPYEQAINEVAVLSFFTAATIVCTQSEPPFDSRQKSSIKHSISNARNVELNVRLPH
jgi:hypothetical protein